VGESQSGPDGRRHWATEVRGASIIGTGIFDDLIIYVGQSAPGYVFASGGHPRLAGALHSCGFEAWHSSHGPWRVL
jgi:hypothetical protein